MPASLGLQLDRVCKRFGQVAALTDVTWSIDAGQCVGVLGSSGSGKTTLLRILAGLEPPDRGVLKYMDSEGSATSARHAIGMVFQNLALWPHLTAREHLACVLGRVTPENRLIAESLLETVHLPASAWDRRPNQLSGGEGQRLALARALASRPQLLLLDEPLAHLDAALRSELLEQIAETIRRLGITTVYVTHSWQEAAALCGRIGVLHQGELVQTGTPTELFWQPADLTIAQLTGPLVTLPRAAIATGRVFFDAGRETSPGICQSAEELYVRPHQLRIVPAEGSNTWQVEDCLPASAGWLLHIKHDCGDRLAVPAPLAVPHGQAIGLQVLTAPG